jgi:hypothetical protein
LASSIFQRNLRHDLWALQAYIITLPGRRRASASRSGDGRLVHSVRKPAIGPWLVTVQAPEALSIPSSASSFSKLKFMIFIIIF